MEFEIKLSTVEQIRNFINKVERYSFNVDLKSGRYLVDAKSIMGIFSLDLLQPITLIAETDENNEDFKNDMKEFMA